MYRTLHSFMLSSPHPEASSKPEGAKNIRFRRFNRRLMLRVLSIALLTGGAIERAQAQYCKPTILAQERSNLSTLPPTAQSGISSALGRDQSIYKATSQSTGFHMQNGLLSADLSASGVEFLLNDNRWDIKFVGLGYADRLRKTGSVAPTSSANRVEYRRDGFTEWYVNGPFGLEQGFTILRAPGKANGEPLTVALGLSGDLTASTDAGRKALTLSRNGVAVLRYTGLTAVDSRGRELHSWLEADRDQLLVRVDDTGASYPLMIDPLVEIASLTACDVIDWDAFGGSAAISADGSTVVVGGRPWSACPDCTGMGAHTSAAYVFVKPSNRFGWSSPTLIEAQAKLVPSVPLLGGSFGALSGVAISGDGSTIAIADLGFGEGTPPVYIYVRPPGGWAQSTPITETARLTPPNLYQAWSVAVSADGTTVVAGENIGDAPGVAYVFVKPSTGWFSTSGYAWALTQSDQAERGDGYGLSAGVSADGSTVAVGAAGWNAGGAVYLFVRPDSGWVDSTETARLVASDFVIGENTGESVSVSGDGNTVVAGSPEISFGGPGKAYIFTKPASGWANGSETAQLTSSDRAHFLGGGVAASQDGSTIAVSIGYPISSGGIYVFNRPATGWASTSGVRQNPQNDTSGYALSMTADGGLILGTIAGGNGTNGSANLFVPVTVAADVSSDVTVTRGGYVYNFSTGRYVQTVTVTNTSTNTIAGPISLVLDNLSSDATLFDATGITSSTTPVGSPYITQYLGTGNLTPGQTASFSLQFTDPTKGVITYTTRVLAGMGAL